MMPKYRAWDKIRKTMYEVDDIMSINTSSRKIIGNRWENPELLGVKQ